MMKTRLLALPLAALLAVAAFGCGAEPISEPESVDHQTTHQAIEQHPKGAAKDSADLLSYLRQTELLGPYVGEIDSYATAGCATPPTHGSAPDGEDGWSDDGSEGGDEDPSAGCSEEQQHVEEGFDEGTDELVDFLLERVFIEAHIEAESDTELTYLLDGDTVCAEDDFADDQARQECADTVDDLEIRLRVTSPAPNDIDIALLVSPQRYQPVVFEIHSDNLASQVNLGDLRDTLEHAGKVTGEPIEELPATMQGRFRAALEHTPNRASLALSVLEDIRVSDDEYDVQIGRSKPAARLTIDSAKESVQALVDVGTVDLRFPVTHTEHEWNAETGEETVTEYNYEVDAHLAGASFDMRHTIGEDEVLIEDIGLGSDTSTLDVDGERVVELDLNRNDARSLDLTLRPTEDGVEATVDPAFDLEMMFAFKRVQDQLADVEDWMLDEMLRVVLDGASNPTVLLGDRGLEVLSGRLELSSTAADVDVEVSAGECLVGGDEVEEPAEAPDDEDDTWDEDDGGDSTSYHPFDGLSAEVCQ